jgi:glucose-6-phosphate 1-epimerase
MVDFGDQEWRGMVCIETANVGRDLIELKPGQSHATTAVIESDC